MARQDLRLKDVFVVWPEAPPPSIARVHHLSSKSICSTGSI
jgi:hypothetical protein